MTFSCLEWRMCFPAKVYQNTVNINITASVLPYFVSTSLCLAPDIKTVWFDFSILLHAHVQLWTNPNCWDWQENKQVWCEMLPWHVQICRRDPLVCGEERRKHSHSPNQLLSRRSHPAALNASVYAPTSCCSVISFCFSVLSPVLFSTVKLVMQRTLVRLTKLDMHWPRRKLADNQFRGGRNYLSLNTYAGKNNLGKVMTAEWYVYMLWQS